MRTLVHRVILTCVLAVFQSDSQAQTESLPAAAEEALKKGIIAASLRNNELAIRYFEWARDLAPEAPVVYYNLGVAESRIPGREIRAIAWFCVFLTADPAAPNRRNVVEQIRMLEERSRAKLSRLIKLVADSAGQIPEDNSYSVACVAKLQAKLGEIAAAQKIAERIPDPLSKVIANIHIAEAQARNGDLLSAQRTWATALRTANLVKVELHKSRALRAIADSQAKGGDTAGAMRIVDLIQVALLREATLFNITDAQSKSGDILGAQKTFGRIQHSAWKSEAGASIAEAQAESGDMAGARATFAEAVAMANIIEDQEWKSRVQATIFDAQARAYVSRPPFAEWLKRLDSSNKDEDCPLNTPPFLNLSGHLNSLPPSKNPREVFDSLDKAANAIADAHIVINRFLKEKHLQAR